MYWVVSLACLLGLAVGLLSIEIQGTVSGYTGKEIAIKLGNVKPRPVNGTTNYQIVVNASYVVSDSTLIGQKINAVMKVHSANGTVIKTTSFPNGFIANKTDTARLLTNIPITLAKNITAEIFFTDLNKTVFLSNVVKALPTISGSVKSDLANKT